MFQWSQVTHSESWEQSELDMKIPSRSGFIFEDVDELPLHFLREQPFAESLIAKKSTVTSDLISNELFAK